MLDLLDPKLLEGMKEVEETEKNEQGENIEVQRMADIALTGGRDRLPNIRPSVTKAHFLPAPGLPTVSNKLAQKIWDLEFVEMEEFLPSNRTIQAMENLVSLQEGIVQQLQQPNKRVLDIFTWIRCFSLYISVMAAKRHELVAPMISHMHMVMRLQATHGGMSWLQYDWRSRREMNAGVEAWQRRDPWQLLSCLPGTTTMEDCFAVTTEVPGPVQPVKHQSGLGVPYLTPGRGQLFTPAGRRQKWNRVCPLFNKARAGCHYGEECIYVHRCSVCKREDHGKWTCPARNQKVEKDGVRQGNR